MYGREVWSPECRRLFTVILLAHLAHHQGICDGRFGGAGFSVIDSQVRSIDSSCLATRCFISRSLCSTRSRECLWPMHTKHRLDNGEAAAEDRKQSGWGIKVQLYPRRLGPIARILVTSDHSIYRIVADWLAAARVSLFDRSQDGQRGGGRVRRRGETRE